MHSVSSNGGELTPELLADEARAAGLDLLAATEHNNVDTHGAWGRCAGDDLLVVPGQEVTTRTGHWLAPGVRPGQVVDWRYGVRDEAIGRWLDEVHRGGGLWRAEGWAEAILRTLRRRHADVPDGVRDRILASTDIDELGTWLDRSQQVTDARELFTEGS
ncbi:hypothetical protein AB0I51_08145 [Streptomyces sp. NPDC050549]|uniref:hypothetical protein n=1 Tax=Streptomyces sp. NPDC050549 TaxID=3155406 RepID=UPI00343D0CC5